MPMCLFALLSAAAVLSLAPPAAGAQARQDGLALVAVIGGKTRQPLSAPPYVYVPAGRSILTWDYRQPDAPRLASTSAPAEGGIRALARRGNLLYAAWRTGSCQRGGVTTYSLADPARPRLLASVADYGPGLERACAAGLVSAGDGLLLFDSENGIYSGDLRDPLRPRFTATGVGHAPVDQVAISGDTVWTAGRTFGFSTLIRRYDVSRPQAPVQTGDYLGDGISMFSVSLAPPLAVAAGWDLSVLDLQAPDNIALLGRGEAPYGAAVAAVIGDHAYGAGFRGLDVWSIADPTQPRLLGNAAIRSFAADTAVTLSDRRALLLGSDDRLLTIDASQPQRPRLAAERWHPGGNHARDIAFHRGRSLLLQQNYGLSVADPRTLVPSARFEPRLAETLEARSYEDWALAGDHAYLLAWGYGLIVVDVSVPDKPREVARLPFPYAGTIAVDGDRAYLGKATNGQELAVVDIADPRAPRLLARHPLPDRPMRLQTRDGLLFVADAGNVPPVPGGLRILDVRDSGRLREVAVWKGDCGGAADLTLDAARARLFMACENGLRVLDVADPAAPRVLGRFVPEVTSSIFGSIAQRGDRVWYGNEGGVYEFDVAAPARPRLVLHTETARVAPIRLRPAPDGRRLYGFTYDDGVLVFARGPELGIGAPR